MLLTINGLETEVHYDHHAIDDVMVPTLRRWISDTQDGRRHYAFLAAPPGAGKSTLAVLLETALRPELQCVGLDGFHLPQAFLETTTIPDHDGRQITMAEIKGAPETFDVPSLTETLERGRTRDIMWPWYDRSIHDVVPEGSRLISRHVLVEGNWLLLDEPGWRELRSLADLTIFLSAPEQLLRNRLITRKIQGGMSREAAGIFYQRTDGPNVRRSLDHSLNSGVDLILTMDENGAIHERNPQ
ncbi:MAG: nucleoside/nucleotide kinase family protein [Acidipropionibacterium sp.]|jgi:pantothenate kinase|nr:nucleoside/nucleotide kinase family protein [Acidipropionibacterium sp.]